MQDWKTELRRTWALQRARKGGVGIEAMVLTPSFERPIRVYTGPDGARHLLVPAGDRDLESVGGEALTCDAKTLVFGGETQRFLDVSCHREELFEVFDDLLASVVEAASESGDPLDAAIETLRRWRELLRAWSTSMSHEAEMALFAELHVLELITRLSETLDPDLWRGPGHEPKDLVGPGWWVEVKAAGPLSASVWINGVEQLQDIPGSEGYLAIVTVAEDPDGRTVEDLAGVLRPRCEDERELDALLLQARWVSRAKASRWAVLGLDVVPSNHCPRLLVTDPTHPGIRRVRYEMDLGIARAQALREGDSVLIGIDGL